MRYLIFRVGINRDGWLVGWVGGEGRRREMSVFSIIVKLLDLDFGWLFRILSRLIGSIVCRIG